MECTGPGAREAHIRYELRIGWVGGWVGGASLKNGI